MSQGLLLKILKAKSSFLNSFLPILGLAVVVVVVVVVRILWELNCDLSFLCALIY